MRDYLVAKSALPRGYREKLFVVIRYVIALGYFFADFAPAAAVLPAYADNDFFVYLFALTFFS